MRMSAVARHFDREQAYDGYSGAALFYCQFSSFDDSAGDGSTNRRRGMSTAPTVSIPARRCITLGDQRWLASYATDDSFLGFAMRKNYNLKRVTDSLTIRSLSQACAATGGTAAYAQKYYFRDVTNTVTDAELDPFWNVFFAPDEPVTQGSFLVDAAGVVHRVRQFYLAPEGFKIAQTDQLDSDARQTAVLFDTGTYNQLTDEVSAGTTSLNVIQFEPFKFYNFRVQAEAPVRPGDRAVFVPSTLTPRVGMTFTMLGSKWQVAMFQAENDGWALHARRA